VVRQGSSTAALAEMAYQLALGGIDVIKDDHGLANQTWSPFEERVTACCAAVAKANEETGKCVPACLRLAPWPLNHTRTRIARLPVALAVLLLLCSTALQPWLCALYANGLVPLFA
jgi:ribulose-bisphosphate carboxylase large chain